jgi:SAM-dependent methyltransferase
MHFSCLLFVTCNLNREEILGKSIIEVGARDYNGSVRPFVESLHPKEYIGVDYESGRGVDVTCDVVALKDTFGKERFDVVISTEMLEHVRHWKAAVHNLKAVCKKDGILLLTTRSQGFPYHGYPYDFWRFECDDMRHIFSDFIMKTLSKDSEMGVFMKCVKPFDFQENDLSDQELYSIVLNHKAKTIMDSDLKWLYFKPWIIKEKIKDSISNSVARILSKL